ncbi:MAG: restriction endonuclease subunit S, partial [Methanosarcinales archaeon]|nr:restriction endonuclease subunit S [Methanosarcinales archaeon]
MKTKIKTTTLGKVGKVSMCKRVMKYQTSEFGDIPFYKISTFGSNADVFIDKKLYNNFRKKYSYPKKGDILISAAGTVGKTVIYNGESAYFQDSNIVWIANDESKILNEYLYYFYQTKPWETTNGSTITRIYNQNLRNIKISYPENLKEQQKIASVLSTLDEKIELNNKINAELEKMAKTLYDYWFVQFDFPDKNGNPYKSTGGKMVYNEKLKREIPEGWEVSKIGKILDKYNDTSKKVQSKDILSSGNFPVITQDTGSFISGYTNEPNPITNLPLIIFGDHSCTLRYVNFTFFRGADGTQILKFEPNLVFYIYLFLQSVITQIPNYGKYERHFKYVKDLKVVIPPKKNLISFQSQIQSTLDKVEIIRKENQKLAELRDWLLPMLMNGQVEVV